MRLVPETPAGAWPAAPRCRGEIVPPGREIVVPPVQLACRGDASALGLGKEGHLAARPAGRRAEGLKARGGAERPLGRGPRLFRGKPCAQRGASTSQQGAAPPPSFVWLGNVSLGQGVVTL